MRSAVFLVLAASGLAAAQTPDVVLRVDVNPHLRLEKDGTNVFRWYDALGRHSTVGLSMILEPGFRLLVTERLQRMPADEDQLDEWYLEDEGVWRIGKQYLPFGREFLLRESVRAARADTNLLIEGLPIAIAACDGGNGRQRGVVARVGTLVGISAAIGRHFGIDGTSLGVVRDPDDAPGEGRGYRTVIGLDFSRRLGIWRLQTEWVAFREGETALDENREVSDVAFSYQESPENRFTVGWSRDWHDTKDVFRFAGSMQVGRGLWLEPLLRFEGSTFKDVGVSLRAKL